MADDDPFGCFGSDEESGSDEENDIIANNLDNERLRLIQSVNNKNQQRIDITSTKDSGKDINDETKEGNLSHSNVKSIQIPKSWEIFKPLYFGPMEVAMIEDCGGGRGYFASKDLKPGTLLLVEESIFTWPDDQIGKELGLQSINALLSENYGRNKNEIFVAIEDLHPTKTDVDKSFSREVKVNTDQVYGMIKKLQERYHESKPDNENIQTLIQLAKVIKIHSSDNSALEERDLLRILLTLRYNGFGSGLYLYFSIFNHDCDPNCIKFFPIDEKSSNSKNYSEIRTTKHVKKGEQLTLHYLDPREVSHCTRRQHLMEQHLFDIGAELSHEHLHQLEFVNGKIPISAALSPLILQKSRNDSESPSSTARVEKTIREMEDMKLELSLAIKMLSTTKDQQIDFMKHWPETFERIKALEMAILELYHVASKEILRNSSHIILIRCLRLHMDTVEMLLLSSENKIQTIPSTEKISLTISQRNIVMSRFVKSGYTLLNLQLMAVGEFHPDIARTYLDLANSIQLLLSASPKLLFEVGKEMNLLNFTQWSKEEARCRKQYKHISVMYPTDTDKYIKKS